MGTYTEHNRQALIDFFESGCKGGDIGRVGVEIEHFLLDEDGERVPYAEKHGRTGLRDVVEALSAYYPEIEYTADGDIVGCGRTSAYITLEPSAQIEFSMAPFLNVSEVEAEYKNFLFRIGQIIDPLDYRLATVGYCPVSQAADLDLIPKPRYHFMDSYFSSLQGMHAERMMRASASLQVSLDYSDEADAVRKMRLASLLGPILAYICDNVPVYEGKANGSPLRRLRVWREVDPQRCGIVPPTIFDEGFGFADYADWLLSVPPIFITNPEEHETGDMSAAEAYADIEMGRDDVLHLLGMVWPDVRLKSSVEVRVADSLPLPASMGYVALIKGLFYAPTTLDILEGALGVDGDSWPYTPDDVEAAIDAIVADGAQADVYGHPVETWIDMLFSLAVDGLGSESFYLAELQEFCGF
ncbi:MAG: glutamate-cysteine ligase family protein [Coriobacteriaceae bacterium]|nr:glutamate-cysteine ligase family protein [Coriobacteriaceae bacterium]